jgi:hypothetical protein
LTVPRGELWELWNAILFGVGLFFFLELGFDSIAIRAKLPWKAYSLRTRTIATTAGASLVCVYAVGTLAFNLASHLPWVPILYLVLPALLLVAAAVGLLLVRRVRGKE